MKVRVSRTVREPVKRSCCGTYAAVPYDICVRWPFTRMSPAAQSDDGVRPARVSRSVVLPAPPPHVCTSRVCMHAPRTCAPRACACMHPARVHLSHVHACTSRVYTSRAERQQVQSHERARACGWTASRCGCWSSGGTVAGGGGSHRTSPKHRGVAAPTISCQLLKQARQTARCTGVNGTADSGWGAWGWAPPATEACT